MNLSKTAKRFLSSTMAIALAGGSVLAFRNSALAGSAQTDTVSFTGDVALECAVVAAPTEATYTAGDNSSNNSDTAGENRTVSLMAETTVQYDCNSDTVQVTSANAGENYTAPSNATDLTATHNFDYAVWETSDGTASYSGSPQPAASLPATLAASAPTDPNGDVSVKIKSEWTADAGAEELFATTYTATVDVTVTAQ
jgi:hypothetical protein